MTPGPTLHALKFSGNFVKKYHRVQVISRGYVLPFISRFVLVEAG